MTSGERTVKLTEAQIEFIKESLNQSARRIREAPIDPFDREAALGRRQQYDDAIGSIKQALGDSR